MSKSCHGLRVQLNWKPVKGSEYSQGAGKYFASSLRGVCPASGIHKLHPDGEKIVILFIIYAFLKGSFHVVGSF